MVCDFDTFIFSYRNINSEIVEVKIIAIDYRIKMIYPEKKKSVEIFLICGKKEENTTTQHA